MSFSGLSRSTARSIDLGGKSKKAKLTRRQLLEEARHKREARARLRLLKGSAVVVQALFRGRTERRETKLHVQQAWDKKIQDILKLQTLLKKPICLPYDQCLPLVRDFNFFFQPDTDAANVQRVVHVCAHVLKNLASGSRQSIITAKFFSKDTAAWLRGRFQLLLLLSNVFAIIFCLLKDSQTGSDGASLSNCPTKAEIVSRTDQIETLLDAAQTILATRVGGDDVPAGGDADGFNLNYIRYLVAGSQVTRGPSLPKIFAVFARLSLPAESTKLTQRNRVLGLVADSCNFYVCNCPPTMEFRGNKAQMSAHAQACAQILRHIMAENVAESQNFLTVVFASRHMWHDIFVDQIRTSDNLLAFAQGQRLFLLCNLLSVLATIVAERNAASPSSSPSRDSSSSATLLSDPNISGKWNAALRLVCLLVKALPSHLLLGPDDPIEDEAFSDLSDDDDDERNELDFSGQSGFVRFMLRQVHFSYDGLQASQRHKRRTVKSTDRSFWITCLDTVQDVRDHAVQQLGVFCSRRFVDTANFFLVAPRNEEVNSTKFAGPGGLHDLIHIYGNLMMRSVCRSHNSALQFFSNSASSNGTQASGGAARDAGVKTFATGKRFQLGLLNALTWAGADSVEPLFVRIWRYIRSMHKPEAVVNVLTGYMRNLSTQNESKNQEPADMVVLGSFITFVTYLFALEGCNDNDFHVMGRPLTLGEAKDVIVVLRDLLFDLLWSHSISSLTWMQKLMAAVSCTLFGQLYSRDSRRSFVDRHVWDWPPLPTTEVNARTLSSGGSSRAALVLATIPQVVPFELRAAMYSAQLDAMRAINQAHAGFGQTGIHLTVRRDSIYQDAMDGLSRQCTQLTTSQVASLLKQRVRIAFVDVHGRDELGVDGGGLFKEFVDVLNRQIFDPEKGFWATTPELQIYPSPESDLVEPLSHLEHFTFMGQMLGLAMYNKISVEPIFANFFLKQLLGQRSEVNDLHSMDPELFSQLMSLTKVAAEDIDEVGLKFEVQQMRFGKMVSVPLMPGGSNISVTAENLQSYIVQLSTFKLNVEFSAQARAFLRGLRMLIPERLFKIFSPHELQTLISGSDKPLDVDDLRRNANVSNHAFSQQREEEYMTWFWETLASLDVSQQQDFLRFVTSCPRPPLLGFSSLYPRFGIQLMGADGDTMLPMAGTCYNLLKLPVYSSKALLAEKLILAISAKAGFEMS
eukprot:INCI10466.1.p1 GENE.INCI10466.1~~INCI10466.1.p1  ORF type:complete len:1198 (-),score=200.13 INCI10466.1:266-3859(-)